MTPLPLNLIDFSQHSAQSIIEFFQNQNNILIVERLKSYGVQLELTQTKSKISHEYKKGLCQSISSSHIVGIPFNCVQGNLPAPCSKYNSIYDIR